MEVFKSVIRANSLAYIHALSPHFCALTFEQHASLIETNLGIPRISPDPVLPRHCGLFHGRCVNTYRSSASMNMLSLPGRSTLKDGILYFISPRISWVSWANLLRNEGASWSWRMLDDNASYDSEQLTLLKRKHSTPS